jgi:hypothetical protein
MQRSASGWTRGAVTVAFLALACAASLRAHVVSGAPTLSHLVGAADVVARARVVDADARLVLDDPPLQRPIVTAMLMEVLKGAVQPGPLRFAQHGHGTADYEDGDEVLLFLQKIERSAELDDLASSGALGYVSLQENDDRFVLTPASREAYLGAARAYVAIARLTDPEARIAALRKNTVTLLLSGEPRLAHSALRDLSLAPGVPLVTEAELPLLGARIDDANAPIGVRIALLDELERRGLVNGPARRAQLLRTTHGADLRAAVRAARIHPSFAVQQELLRLLRGGDEDVAVAAAIALGTPHNAAAVDPLAQALVKGDTRLRMAAIRGLGGIGTRKALQVLEATATSHPHPDTRRRAKAEAMLLVRRPVAGPEPSSRPRD